jgi:hypothetical protein
MNLEQHRREYHLRGFTVVRNYLSRPRANEWSETILGCYQAAGAPYQETEFDRVAAEGVSPAPCRYHILDRLALDRHCPGMGLAYLNALQLLQDITFMVPVVSPYERSAYNALVYEPGGSHGWHLDTNGITGLLYLTDGPGTIVQPLSNLHPAQMEYAPPARAVVQAEAGALLLMQGRKVRHCGEAVPTGYKVSCPWNYYELGDTWRPAGADAGIYKK